MDGVKIIRLPSILLTLFIHVHIGIIKNHSSFRQNKNKGKLSPSRYHLGSFVENEINANSLQQFNVEKQFFFHLLCAYEHFLPNVNPAIFRCLIVVGTIVPSNLSQFVILNIRSCHYTHFFKSVVKNVRGIPENTEKGLKAIPANSWPLHGVRGLQVSQLFPKLLHKIHIYL